MLDWFHNSRGKYRIREMGSEAVLIGTRKVRARTGPRDTGFVIGKVVAFSHDGAQVCVVGSDHREMRIDSNRI